MPLAATLLMKFRAYLRATKFILGSFNANPKPAPALKRESTPGGTAFDRYIPAGEPIRTVIVIYGIALAGEQDLRAIRIGSLLANLGVEAIVPVLPGLKSYAATVGDYELLVDLISYLHTLSGKPLGMLASSLGGGIGLAVTADARVADMLDLAVLFSPYYELPDVAAALRAMMLKTPQTTQEWDDFTWSMMVAAYRNLNKLDFSVEEIEQLKEYLWNSFSKPLQPRLDYYERVLKNRDLFADEDLRVPEEVREMLSPRGKIGHVKARVVVLHDTHDQLILPLEAEKILAELSQRPHPHQQEILVTPWLNHVTPRLSREMLDIFMIVGMMAKLFIKNG